MSEQELLPQIAGQTLMSRLGPVEVGGRGIQLRTMEDVFRFAKAVSTSKLCPPGFSETDCFLVIEHGLELGLSPIAALQSTYIVNNRATIFGDMPLALVRQSGFLEDYKQEYVGNPYDDDYKCVVTTKRKGMAEALVTEYSVADAKQADVWDKRSKEGRPSPWVTAPKRMLMFRARGFNLRDNFGDVLKGCAIGELDDGENLPGFENAKTARVVEPSFEGPKAEAVSAASPIGPGILSEQPSPSPEASKRRGRPRKSAEPTSSINQSSAPEPELKDKTAQAPPEAPEAEPQVLADDLVNEVAKRLDAERIPIGEFLVLMHRNAFLEGDLKELTLNDVDPEGLEVALKQWDQVVARLKGANK
jgi:hypothetical protein